MKGKDSKGSRKIQSPSSVTSSGTVDRAVSSGGAPDLRKGEDQTADSVGRTLSVDSHLYIEWEKEEGDNKWEEEASVPSRVASSLLFDDNLLPPENPDTRFCSTDAESARFTYQKACEELGVVPSSKFLRDLHCGRTVLTHQGLGPLGIKAISVSLAANMTLRELYLAGNRLGPRGMHHLAEMIATNRLLRVLDISNNDLGTVGASILGGMIETNDTLHSIRAASNSFGDTASQYIGEALKYTSSLKDLDISENHFEEIGGVLIGEGLASNHSLEGLDISYNRIRRKGIMAFALALKGDSTLKSLNLAWNGVGVTGAKQLGAGLADNNLLVSLDVTGCRICMDAVTGFFQQFGNNTTLKSINFSQNPLTSADATVLIKQIMAKPECGIESVQISNLMVSKEFLKALDVVKETKPNFTVVYSDVLGSSDAPRARLTAIDLERGDPMDILVKYVRAKRLRLVDLFSRLDMDKSNTITREELIRGMQNAGVMMSIAQMDRLLMKLDQDGNGEVELGELISAHKLHLRKRRKNNKPLYPEDDEEEEQQLKSTGALVEKIAVENAAKTESFLLTMDEMNMLSDTPAQMGLSSPLGMKDSAVPLTV